jgi:DNA-binding transcriptional LysR family regulator
MNYRGLDLNLLVALEALLETRSPSAAARRMNLSQPAMSAALSRLRLYFGDDLLVVDGKRMYPTAFAEGVLPTLKDCLRGLDGLILTRAGFEPETAHRAFSIIASDYVTAAILVPLIARLAVGAPGVSIDILSPGEDNLSQLADGRVDLLITPDGFMHPAHPGELLYKEDHVVAGWSGNAIFDGEVTEEVFLEAGHVAVALGRERIASFADRHLAIMGKLRRIEVTAASFTAVPWLLRDTGRLALMHRRLAISVAEFFPIRFAPIPFDFPIMSQMVQHHNARSRDEGLTWLRRELLAVAAK